MWINNSYNPKLLWVTDTEICKAVIAFVYPVNRK